MLQIHHRGGFPENALEAFRRSPCLHWETDVRQTADGQLVLLHDATVNRTTPHRGWLTDLGLAQVPGLPTFREFLALARQRGAHVYAELKVAGIERQVVALLREAQVQATVISFSEAVLRQVRVLAPELPVGRLLYPWETRIPPGHRLVIPCGETLLLCPWMVVQGHRQGCQVYAWFLGLESLRDRLRVDGVIVNRPR